MQRKLNFYLFKEENQFKLRVIEIRKGLRGPGFIDPMLIAIMNYGLSFISQLPKSMARLNQLIEDTREAVELYWSYAPGYRQEWSVDDICDHNEPYDCHEQTYLLPTTPTELLKLIGSLDSALHTIVYGNEDDFVLEFFDKEIDFSRRAEICHYALAFRKKSERRPSKPLSRFLAEWLIRELTKDAETQLAHQPLLDCLMPLMVGTGSLTPAIRQFLYPTPAVSLLIKQHCAAADDVIKAILNPDVTVASKTDSLLAHIRGHLTKKANKNDKLSEEEKNKLRDKVHGEITEWFVQYEKYKNKLWHLQIETLYGNPADDTGFYTSNYTEIRLLKEASFVLNKNGLIELRFLKTDRSSYMMNYALGRKLYNKLETELSLACGDLDLHFVKGQNFHESAVFDEDSSALLKQRGYHFNEEDCKTLMHKINANAMMRLRVVDRAGTVFAKVPGDLMGVFMEWVKVACNKEAAEKKAKLDETIKKGVPIRLFGDLFFHGEAEDGRVVVLGDRDDDDYLEEVLEDGVEEGNVVPMLGHGMEEDDLEEESSEEIIRFRRTP